MSNKLISRLRIFGVSHTSTALGACLLMLVGCASAPRFDEKSVTKVQKGQTYLESKGADAGKARITTALAEGVAIRKEKVMWGGVTFAGSGLPAGVMPLCARAVGTFQDKLVSRLRASKPGMFEIGGLGAGVEDNLKARDALVIIVCLSYERISERSFTDKRRVDLQVSGQVLFIDTKASMQVTAAYPIGVVEADLFTGDLTDDHKARLASEALSGTRRTAEGKALSLCDQVVDLIEQDAVVPRSLFPPVAVARVELGDGLSRGDVSGKGIALDASRVQAWGDILASAFSSYLGANSGFPVNPYTGGAMAIGSDSTLSAAAQITMRRTDNQQLNATLRKPTYIFKLRITQLHATESKDSKQTFLAVMDYGFSGSLTVLDADRGSQVLVLPIDIPGRSGGGIPSKLARKYKEITAVNVRRDRLASGDVDHAEYWRGRIEEFLLQLAREITFPEEDLGKRFDPVRQKVRRNASLRDASPKWIQSAEDSMTTARGPAGV